jgi:hypothetical protein
LTLDAGALIAFERRDRRVAAIVLRALESGAPLAVPAGALAQAWRGGAGTPLRALIADPVVRVEELTRALALAAGELCGAAGTADVVDASVVLVARRYGGRVATGDAAELRRLDRTLDIVPV